MSISSILVFHYHSALELMTDSLEHNLVDREELSQLLEGRANHSDDLSHQYMRRSLKRMIDQYVGSSNVVGFSKETRGPDT